jgi:hypothetical protein
MKLIAVDCWRDTDEADVEPRRCVVFAETKEEAEQLSREAHADDGFTHFEAQEPIAGPFPGPARVIHYAGRRMTGNEMPAGERLSAPTSESSDGVSRARYP